MMGGVGYDIEHICQCMTNITIQIGANEKI